VGSDGELLHHLKLAFEVHVGQVRYALVHLLVSDLEDLDPELVDELSVDLPAARG